MDTPPSRSALDFLDAPQRLGRFLDGRFIRLLLAPARGGPKRVLRRGLGSGSEPSPACCTKILGAELLTDLSAFVAALDTMFGGFRQRAERDLPVLQDRGTAFLVVAAPEPDALREAAYFVERLAEERMPLAGLVLNRVHRSAGGHRCPRTAAWRAAERAGRARRAPADGRRCCGCMPTRMQQITREQHLMRGFASAFPHVALAQADALPSDVHDLDGLRAVGRSLACR